jgi:hypothetical protein
MCIALQRMQPRQPPTLMSASTMYCAPAGPGSPDICTCPLTVSQSRTSYLRGQGASDGAGLGCRLLL